MRETRYLDTLGKVVARQATPRQRGEDGWIQLRGLVQHVKSEILHLSGLWVITYVLNEAAAREFPVGDGLEARGACQGEHSVGFRACSCQAAERELGAAACADVKLELQGDHDPVRPAGLLRRE